MIGAGSCGERLPPTAAGGAHHGATGSGAAAIVLVGPAGLRGGRPREEPLYGAAMSTREDYPAGVPCWVDTTQH
ncbi:MAG: hypothetical protein M3486_08000, partial [Actinomycetota bacterium]|nr:hypothetical protein [Actinomycetota bacterium]